MSSEIKISVEDLTFSYGDHVVLDRVAAQFATHRITAITGPSGQGKSTFLCAINRLSDEIPGARVAGRIEINFEDGKLDVYRDRYYLPDLRRRVGLVFQKPNPLPISIARNVMLPLALAGRHSRARKLERCEAALRDAFLWDEVKDRLDQSALELSGGQQQRLCIARALVLRPEIIMLDEPTSSLDSEAAGQVEELLKALRDRCTIIVVSHYLEQVSRIADRSYRIKDRKVVPVS